MNTPKILAALVATALLITGCSGDGKDTPSSSSTPSTPTSQTPKYTEPGGGEASAEPKPSSSKSPFPKDESKPDMDSSFFNDTTMTPERALFTLSVLPVATPESLNGYTRGVYVPGTSAAEAGWPAGDLPSKRCNVTAAALIRDATDVKVNDRCGITAGDWRDPFLDKKFSGAASMRATYVVPSEEIWRSGGAQWSEEQAAIYSSAPVSLIAASDETGSSRGSKSINLWTPPYTGARCGYATRWVAVKNEFGLNLSSETEREALRKMLDTCVPKQVA